jgi:hypothetical protein
MTAALQSLGVFLGDRLMSGAADNPRGFYEDLDLTAVNNSLLADAGCAWDSLVLPDLRLDYPDAYSAAQARARDTVRERFCNKRLWAFKDPRTVRLISFWLAVLQAEGCQPLIVAALRHPGSVADSLKKRDQMPRAKALALWLIHQSEALEVLRRLGGLVIDYDDLISSPYATLERLGAYLSITVERDSPSVQHFTNGVLENGLRHSFYGLSQKGISNDELGHLCWRLYEQMRSRSVTSGVELEEGQLLAELAEYRTRMAEWFECADAYGAREREYIAAVTKRDAALTDKDRELATRGAMITGLNQTLLERDKALSSLTDDCLALRRRETAIASSLAETRQELFTLRGIIYRKVFVSASGEGAD